MNHAMYATSVTALCLFYVISFAGCPITASAYSLQHELEQDQIESLLSQFARSRGDEDGDDWTELQDLEQRWERDQSQIKRRESVRRRAKGCNPVTGRCSAGWKRSPSVPIPRLESLEAATEFDARSIDLPQTVSSPYQAAKRDAARPLQFSGRRQMGVKGYPRALRRPKCNQLNGRCSAGWKRSPTPLSGGRQSLGSIASNRMEENVFDILERLQNDEYRQRLPNISI